MTLKQGPPLVEQPALPQGSWPIVEVVQQRGITGEHYMWGCGQLVQRCRRTCDSLVGGMEPGHVILLGFENQRGGSHSGVQTSWF